MPKVRILVKMNIELLFDKEDIPGLAAIWDSAEHQEFFSEASLEWLNGYLEAKERGFLAELVYFKKEGRIWIFIEDGRAIGVSGWCPCSSDWLGETAFMRWHGVVKEYRGKDISGLMLLFIIVNIGIHGINTVLELSESEKAKNYFLHKGFTIETDPRIIKEARIDAGDFKHVLRYDIK